jgi:hypothetical protein
MDLQKSSLTMLFNNEFYIVIDENVIESHISCSDSKTINRLNHDWSDVIFVLDE